MAGAGVADDRGGHEADRPRAGDQHVLAEHGEGERRVDRVPERVEDRGDVLVDAVPVVPDVRHRQDDELRERAVAADSQADGVRAQVAPAGQAVAAASADDVAFAAHEVSGREVGNVRAHLHHLAHELVADHERRLDGLRGPRVPGLDVEVRAADPRLVDADQHVVDADGRVGPFPELQARSLGGLDQGEHGCLLRSVWAFVRRGAAAGVSAAAGRGSTSGEQARRRRSRRRGPIFIRDRVGQAADPLDLDAHDVAGHEKDGRIAEDADS